jgi:hypothetical protein
MLPSQWHYAVCNFTDGGSALPADASSTATEIRYTIRPEDKDKRLYLASSHAGACSKGQRILIRLPCPTCCAAEATPAWLRVCVRCAYGRTWVWGAVVHNCDDDARS